MELHLIRGGNEASLKNKEYTIGIGISLGNKWFTIDNIMGLIKWSFKYSKGKVIVYVADSIHAINIEVRNRIEYEKAFEKANNQGDLMLQSIESKVKKEFSEEDAKKIMYVKWDDIADTDYKKKVEYLKDIYNHEGDFQKTIHSLIKEFTSKEERNFSDNEIHRLGDYILEELPEIINRVQMKGVVCDACVYPFDSTLTKLVEEIQRGEKFSEIKKNIMDTEPKVFLEVR